MAELGEEKKRMEEEGSYTGTGSNLHVTTNVIKYSSTSYTDKKDAG